MSLRVPAVPRVGVVASSVALLLAAVLLIFPRLDDRYLWEDEAETALLAKNALRFGVPVAYDGRDLISQECGGDYDANYLWRQAPWLPIYLTAASFTLFGADAFSARLPFALLGLAALPSLWALARLAFDDRRVARLAVLCLLASVPFLLHVRQARYYALAIFASIWLLYFFFAALRGRRFAAVGLAAALTVLFHSNYLVALAMAAGLVASLGVAGPDRAALGRLAAGGAGAIALNLPWALLFDFRGKADFVLSDASLRAFLRRLGFYLSGVELHAFPSLLLLPSLGIWLLARRRDRRPVSGGRAAACLAVVILVQLVALSLTPLLFHRYVVNLLPALALLIAWIVSSVATTRPLAAGLLLALTLLVDRADLVRLAPGSTLLKYLDEITHDFEGPIEAIARYLERAAAPGDRVFITYGNLALRFHTALDVRGGLGCEPLADARPPDWIIARYFLRLNPVSPRAPENARETVRYLNALLASRAYRHIELPAIDTVHDSIPEPDQHRFRAPREGRHVTLFHRSSGAAATP